MNFILFCPDEMRAESLGCYGHPLVETPHIDRLATEGARFTDAHCQHTVCSPSRCSFMTGWYAHTQGHRTLWHLLRPHEPNLLRYLKEAGYEVLWLGKNDTLSAEATPLSCHRWQEGREYASLFGPRPHTADDPRHDSFLYEPNPCDPREHGDFGLVQQAIEYLRNGPTQPFVINLNLTFPHCPYSAPQPWHDRYRPEDLPPLRPHELARRPLHHELIRKYRRLDQVGQDHLRKIHAVYLGMISFVDHMLGELLETLEQTGHDRDTTIIFFSDHGDYAGDFGLVEKWTSGLEDVLTRVPLIIRAPGMKAGHVVDAPTELFDITPTTLELAGIEARHTHFAQSLVPQLRGHAGDEGRAAFTEGGYGAWEPHCFEGFVRDEFRQGHIYYPKIRMQQERPDSIGRCAKLCTRDWSFVHRPGGQGELYDRRADPGELTNLYEHREHRETVAAMTRRLLDHMVRSSDVVPFDRDSRGLPPAV